MAIKTFNSVGGFSVGEAITTVIHGGNTDISSANAVFSGNVSVLSGNASVLRLKTDNLLHADGTPWDFDTANGLTNYVQFKGSTGDLAGNINFQFSETSNLLTANSNANIAGATFTYQNGNANVTANYFIGRFDGAISGAISSPGSDTEIAFNDAGILNVSSKMTFIKSTGNLKVLGNANLVNLTTSNYFSGYFDSLSNNQANITQVGTLVNANVNGNLQVGNLANVGNLQVVNTVNSNLIPLNDNVYTLGNGTRMWGNIWTGSNIWIGTDAYIRAIGNIIQIDAINVANETRTLDLKVRRDATIDANLVVSGNLTVSGTTTYINVTNLSTKDPLISLGSDNNSNLSTTPTEDRGLILRNYNTIQDRPQNQFLGWSTSSGEFRAIADILNWNTDVITANSSAAGSGYANIRAFNFIGNLTGTVNTASQPDITSLGTLTGLTVHTGGLTGNITVDNANVLGQLRVSNITYPTADGTAGQVLTTNGANVLSFATIDTYRISNGTSNVTVNGPGGNVEIVSAGNITVTVTDNWANVTGNAYVSNNLTVANVTTVGKSLLFTNYYPNGVISTSVTSMSSQTRNTNSIATISIATVVVAGTSYRGVEFFVKGEDAAGGKYTVATVVAVHNGATTSHAVYGTVNIGGALHSSFDVTYISGSGTVNLQVTPATNAVIVWTTQIRMI